MDEPWRAGRYLAKSLQPGPRSVSPPIGLRGSTATTISPFQARSDNRSPRLCSPSPRFSTRPCVMWMEAGAARSPQALARNEKYNHRYAGDALATPEDLRHHRAAKKERAAPRRQCKVGSASSGERGRFQSAARVQRDRPRGARRSVGSDAQYAATVCRIFAYKPGHLIHPVPWPEQGHSREAIHAGGIHPKPRDATREPGHSARHAENIIRCCATGSYIPFAFE